MGKIVVGVDGSDSSRKALKWAIEEARLRKDGVEAVHAWTYPAMAPAFEAMVQLPADLDLEKEAAAFVARVVSEVEADGVAVKPIAVRGPASTALVEASDGADLLVIGSRGFGGFRGLLLGSVGHQVAQHARCPVVIVPADVVEGGE